MTPDDDTRDVKSTFIITNVPFLSELLGLCGTGALVATFFWTRHLGMTTGVSKGLLFLGGVVALFLYDVSHKVTYVDVEKKSITMWRSLVSLFLFTKKRRPFDDVVVFEQETRGRKRQGESRKTYSFWFSAEFVDDERWSLGMVGLLGRRGAIAAYLERATGKVVVAKGDLFGGGAAPMGHLPRWVARQKKIFGARIAPFLLVPLAVFVSVALAAFDAVSSIQFGGPCEELADCCERIEPDKEAECRAEAAKLTESDCREALSDPKVQKMCE